MGQRAFVRLCLCFPPNIITSSIRWRSNWPILTLWILRVGGRGSFTSKSFIFFLLFSFLDVFSKFLMSFVKFVKLFSVFKERSLFLSVFNYTLQDYDTRRKRWGVVLVEGGGFEAHC